jgi:SAM-dependent methyltransferase
MANNLSQEIFKANLAVHKYESKYYQLLHPEIYNRFEQARLTSWLKVVNKLLNSDDKTALDFGSGSGNLTSKLLKLDYKVTAIDISYEMCAILKDKFKKDIDKKRLKVINQSIEDAALNQNEFDLICCYSVLHHLPDYVKVIKKLSTFLKKGGIMYIDHEASPFEWIDLPKVKRFFIFSNRVINMQYLRLLGLHVPPSRNLDYNLSDYWTLKKHHIDHEKIEGVFKEDSFDFSTRIDYYSYYTWVLNPAFYVYKYACKPEVSCWIAKK